MYITKGIIVDTGAAYVQDPLYDDKLKVRIPELHGFGDIAKNFQEEPNSYTKDENLPWCTLLATATDYYSYYPVLQYKAQNYGPADMVYVQVDTSSPDTVYLVVGLYAKYNDGSEASLNIYNGLDVDYIIENNVEFPQELLQVYGSSSSSDNTTDETNPDDGTNPDTPDDPGEPGGDNKGNTKDKWKYYFGHPYAKGTSYYISAGFPYYSSGRKHGGVDLATHHKTGIPIYSIADGEIITSTYGGLTGNYVVVKHSDPAGYYSIYEHLENGSRASVGTKVYSGKLIADTKWENAYKKEVDATGKTVFTALRKKPKDWDHGGWSQYYKQTGTSRNPKHEKIGDVVQKATPAIGKVGLTGDTSGAHLHLGLCDQNGPFWNAHATDGHLKDARNYISL